MPDSQQATSGVSADSGGWRHWWPIRHVGIPAGLLAAGVIGFVYLSREPAKPKAPATRPQAVRTRVIEVRVRDFPVVL